MVPHSSLLNALRELGYSFKRSGHRADLWKEKGGVKRVSVPRSTNHPPESAGSILGQAGMSRDDIQRFISNYRTNG